MKRYIKHIFLLENKLNNENKTKDGEHVNSILETHVVFYFILFNQGIA